MNSIITSLRNVGFLTIALTLALAANFAYGQWANPTTTAPGGNVAVPVNISSANQIKTGNITAWRQKAGDQMWSPEYCDENGDNCFNTVTCSEGQVMVADAVGNWICADMPGEVASSPTYSNCTLDGVTVAHGSERRFYRRTSATNCNSYDEMRRCNDGTLDGDDRFNHRSCSTVAPTPTPPPTPVQNYLVFGQHTSSQCTSLGGSVVSDSSGEQFCRFNQNSCPSGWAQYQNWSTTRNKECGDASHYLCRSAMFGVPNDCDTGSHNWSNSSPEQCAYNTSTRNYGPDYCIRSAGTCTARVTEIGCY